MRCSKSTGLYGAAVVLGTGGSSRRGRSVGESVRQQQVKTDAPRTLSTRPFHSRLTTFPLKISLSSEMWCW